MFSCRFLYSQESDFRTAIVDLLQLLHSNRIVRLVFFGAPESNDEYLVQLHIIKDETARIFGEMAPLTSFVAQKPLYPSGVIVEIHELLGAYNITHKTVNGDSYLLLQTEKEQHLLLGGIINDNLHDDIATQSATVFARINAIMQKEGFPIESIVRQWNYIEGITVSDGNRQHYQDFNDARSLFYANASSWSNGYPAATGIGTQFGGIMIDLQASLFTEIHPIDNELQVSAHEYSTAVLIGDATQKSTPKFERAKALLASGGNLVFVSGTAAIRGEKTLEVDTKKQTRITIENIEFLISSENLKKYGVTIASPMHMKCLRIYLKHPEMLQAAQKTVQTHYPETPQIYLFSDICRDNLLIEIEGIAK